jgi:RNA polymerase sigma-B factor
MIDSPDPPAGSDDDDDADRRLDPLLDELAATPARDPHRQQLRDHLVTELLPVARQLARRFARRGVAEDDLFQVASLGLLKSLDRYEPERATSGFLPYAIITMRGEIRRYFRDHTWSMRVPRRLKEATQLVSQASQELAAELERAPRPSEIATRTGLSSEEVLEALQAEQAYTSRSLDQPVGTHGETGGATRGDLLGGADARLELVEEREALKPLLAQLPERERTILMLRFYGNQTQSQIAQHIGISQMHVSRLLSTTLDQLREEMIGQ